MQLRAFVLAAGFGVAGFVAGRSAQPSPVAAATPRCDTRPLFLPRLAEPEPEPGPDLDPDPSAGSDIADLLVAAAAATGPHVPPSHNAIVGRALDPRSDEGLAGATIVVAGPAIPGPAVAITDEHGDYAIPDLPSGTYLVTFYYLELTLERDRIAVSDLQPTEVTFPIIEVPQ